MKDYLVHCAQPIELVSASEILIAALIKDFCICITDVKLAYLQSDTLLTKKIFISSPVSESKLSSGEFLEFFRPTYGLLDSEDE